MVYGTFLCVLGAAGLQDDSPPVFFQSPLTRSMGRGVTSHFKRSLNHCRYWFLRKHRGMEGGPGAWFQLKRSHKSSLTAVSPTKSASAIIATFSASAPSHLEKFQLSPPAWRMLFHWLNGLHTGNFVALRAFYVVSKSKLLYSFTIPSWGIFSMSIPHCRMYPLNIKKCNCLSFNAFIFCLKWMTHNDPINCGCHLFLLLNVLPLVSMAFDIFQFHTSVAKCLLPSSSSSS